MAAWDICEKHTVLEMSIPHKINVLLALEWQVRQHLDPSKDSCGRNTEVQVGKHLWGGRFVDLRNSLSWEII